MCIRCSFGLYLKQVSLFDEVFLLSNVHFELCCWLLCSCIAFVCEMWIQLTIPMIKLKKIFAYKRKKLIYVYGCCRSFPFYSWMNVTFFIDTNDRYLNCSATNDTKHTPYTIVTPHLNEKIYKFISLHRNEAFLWISTDFKNGIPLKLFSIADCKIISTINNMLMLMMLHRPNGYP